MEPYERDNFIQIDYHNNCFVVVCLRSTETIPGNDNSDKADFGILQRFNDSLEDAIKFATGAISAIRLFKEEEYRPAEYLDIYYTKDARKQIKSKKYRTAMLLYPDLKTLRKGW